MMMFGNSIDQPAVFTLALQLVALRSWSRPRFTRSYSFYLRLRPPLARSPQRTNTAYALCRSTCLHYHQTRTLALPSLMRFELCATSKTGSTCSRHERWFSCPALRGRHLPTPRSFSSTAHLWSPPRTNLCPSTTRSVRASLAAAVHDWVVWHLVIVTVSGARNDIGPHIRHVLRPSSSLSGPFPCEHGSRSCLVHLLSDEGLVAAFLLMKWFQMSSCHHIRCCEREPPPVSRLTRPSPLCPTLPHLVCLQGDERAPDGGSDRNTG